MAKKFFPRALSVGLSLALCAGLVLPSFAAQVLNNENKNQFIDNNGALLGHDGNGGSGNQYDYELGENLELEKTLIIKDGVDASIDLKGNDLVQTGKTGSVIDIKGGGKLTLDDTMAGTGEDGKYTAGAVTGGKATFEGGGVHIEKDGSFDLKDGKISGNQAQVGGGVSNGGGTFNMSGGEISDNKTTRYDGGGIVAWAQSTTNMSGGKITGNEAYGDGGGVCLCEKSTFHMSGGEISNNKAPGKQHDDNNGGGIAIEIAVNKKTGEDISSDFTMTGGSIIGNEAISTGCNGISFYTPFNYVNEYQRELAGDHIKISDNAVICNGDGEDAMVTEQHKYVNWHVTTPAGIGVEGEETGTCEYCTATATRPIDPPPAPAPVPATEIEDEEVPLSGIFTRADAIGYLWQRAGEPDAELSDFADVPEDHEWAVAIGWGQDMGIALADLEGNFRPDDLVLRSTEDVEGELQEFLNRYAVYAGVELAEGELFIQLAGAPDDVIMGEEAQVIFDEFFAKLEAALSQAA